jgi:hypothetical protein
MVFSTTIIIVITIAIVAANDCMPGSNQYFNSAFCKNEGDRCVSNSDCITGVCYTGLCVRDASGKRCSQDADCDSFFSYSECRDDHCVRIGLTGDACRTELDCSSGLCLNGICIGVNDGLSCFRSAQCRSASICLNGQCLPTGGSSCLLGPLCSNITEDCLVSNSTCIRRRTTSVGGDCVTDRDCQLGLICGRVEHKCVAPAASTPDRMQKSCAFSTDCPSPNTQECVCTHYPDYSHRCVTAGAPQSVCLVEEQAYMDCMHSAGCSIDAASVSLRKGQCALQHCASESYLLIECRAYDDACRPFMIDLIRQWTDYKGGSSSSSSLSSTSGENDNSEHREAKSNPPWTWAFVSFFSFAILALIVWVTISLVRKRLQNIWSWRGK